jgi:predicted PurR-regulated permease PerM
VVFTVYFLLDLPRLRDGVVRLFPVERRQRYGQMEAQQAPPSL